MAGPTRRHSTRPLLEATPPTGSHAPCWKPRPLLAERFAQPIPWRPSGARRRFRAETQIDAARRACPSARRAGTRGRRKKRPRAERIQRASENAGSGAAACRRRGRFPRRGGWGRHQEAVSAEGSRRHGGLAEQRRPPRAALRHHGLQLRVHLPAAHRARLPPHLDALAELLGRHRVRRAGEEGEIGCKWRAAPGLGGGAGAAWCGAPDAERGGVGAGARALFASRGVGERAERARCELCLRLARSASCLSRASLILIGFLFLFFNFKSGPRKILGMFFLWSSCG